MSKMIVVEKVAANELNPYTQFEAATKTLAEYKVRSLFGGCYWSSIYRRLDDNTTRSVTGLVTSDRNYAILVHYEKRRKKVERTSKVHPKIVNDEMMLTYTSRVIYPRHWKVTVYKIPLSRIRLSIQHARRFKLVLVY